eukprot:TRINITY_DN60442_c0_g1_i1.p1 TRINITY_DN60442_c0_g1~~TRINITY_DN60442_c0_g1_i1.p1  ORF type:complete len:525 (+),score=110.65 TRINITY_DN60442_c0_g1_i1:134-1576(+)
MPWPDAPPHVVLMVLDDVGWADWGLRGSDFPTPNIDALASSSALLDRFYVQPVCSPTRSVFMTGRYPFRTGMQHTETLVPGSTAHLPLDVPTAAELFRSTRKYETHMIGKWHLGYAKFEYTPVGRGFDSFTGYMQGQIDYFNHTVEKGLDWWDNSTGKLKAVYNHGYSMSSYSEAAERIIGGLAPGKSLFLYYAHQEIHLPIEYPPDNKFQKVCGAVPKNVPSPQMNRQALCSMMANLDDQVGQFVGLLQRKNMWANTLMWVTADNGGMTHWSDQWPASVSSNWPLRGGKATLFEGGVRVTAFVAGGALPAAARGITVAAPIHAVDVLPTLAGLAGIAPRDDWDGRNVWAQIAEGAGPNGPREIPLNIVEGGKNYSALIYGDLKLIVGRVGVCDGYWTTGVPYERIDPPDTTGMPKLFNLTDDPLESVNLADSRPDDVAALTARIARWADGAAGFLEPQDNSVHTRSLPWLHEGVWAPFL